MLAARQLHPLSNTKQTITMSGYFTAVIVCPNSLILHTKLHVPVIKVYARLRMNFLEQINAFTRHVQHQFSYHVGKL